MKRRSDRDRTYKHERRKRSYKSYNQDRRANSSSSDDRSYDRPGRSKDDRNYRDRSTPTNRRWHSGDDDQEPQPQLTRYWDNPEDKMLKEQKKPEPPARKSSANQLVDMLTTRTGGAYIPPAKLRMMQAEITDKTSVAYQRIAWEALKKSIHGHINKVNTSNIGIITRELLKENIIRGRGLLARSIIQSQAASPTFTGVYAALVAVINCKFPSIGELIIKRLATQFKRGFRRNGKALCVSTSTFIAHLVNQNVAHEILILEILTLLVERPTDDAIEVSIAILKECGMKLSTVCRKGIEAIFEMLRNILHEGKLDKRVQYMIEVMFQIRKDGFKDFVSVPEDLDLVEEDNQITHEITLDDANDTQDILNVFKHDPDFVEVEEKYKTLSREVLGEDSDESGSEGGDEDDDDEDDSDANSSAAEEEPKASIIIDNTETNLIALRRTIYLTIHSSLNFEECAHKLMKMQLKPGQEIELCHMFLDCCAEMRTYEKFYGLLAGRFCAMNKIYVESFEKIFIDSYDTIHRLDTNKLRNVAKFFAHLLITDSISWEVLSHIKLNEEDTTSSGRVFIKILFQELSEYIGITKLNQRVKDVTLQQAFEGLFPRDDPKNTRFSINFFTLIGLGGLTDDLREHLKSRPKPAPVPQITEKKEPSSSETSSESSSSSSSSESSDSEEEKKKKRKKKRKEKKEKKIKKKKKK